jgi:hypothetical protein
MAGKALMMPPPPSSGAGEAGAGRESGRVGTVVRGCDGDMRGGH